MKKKLLSLALLLALALMLAACSEGAVFGKTVIFDDQSGKKTVTVRVWGDQEALDGRDYTPGNNTAFMLSQGEDLIAKLEEFCELKEDVTFYFIPGETNKDSSYITMTFSFSDIADYNAKGRTIAGKNAEQWTDAVLTKNGDELTFTESAQNLKLLYLDILEKYFSDFDCYPVYEYGPATQSQVIPNGIQFEGDDLYAFSWWIVAAGNEIVIGDTAETVSYFNPAEDYNYRADLTNEIVTASGKGAPAPTLTALELIDPQTEYNVGDAFVPFKANAVYSDGTREVISIGPDMVTGFDSDISGAATLTITYKTVSTSYDIQLNGGSATEPMPIWLWFVIGFTALLGVSLILTFYTVNKEKKKNGQA